jgi:predicted AAA+ superfamily ATPase
LLYQIIQDILQTTPKEHIVYINFEDERLDISFQDLQKIIEAYQEMYPNISLHDVYFFFDEIQNVSGWEKFVRRIFDQYSQKIFLTGSSAKLLSKEIATSLRGRSISYEIFPLSFKEYLSFVKQEEDVFSSVNKAKIKHLFLEYMNTGGFIEIFYQKDERIQRKILQNYSEVMLYRDIVERYSIKNPEGLRFFIKKCLSQIGNLFSVHKTYNELKSQGVSVSKDSVYLYPNYLEDIYYLFFLKKFQYSFSVSEQKSKKVYAIDTGLVSALSFQFSENRGAKLENIVFLEYKRKEKEVYFHNKKYECDFIEVSQGKVVSAVQVTESLQNKETKEREVRGLLEAMNDYNLSSGIILSLEDEETKEVLEDSKIIHIIPLWKWLL